MGKLRGKIGDEERCAMSSKTPPPVKLMWKTYLIGPREGWGEGKDPDGGHVVVKVEEPDIVQRLAVPDHDSGIEPFPELGEHEHDGNDAEPVRDVVTVETLEVTEVGDTIRQNDVEGRKARNQGEHKEANVVPVSNLLEGLFVRRLDGGEHNNDEEAKEECSEPREKGRDPGAELVTGAGKGHVHDQPAI